MSVPPLPSPPPPSVSDTVATATLSPDEEECLRGMYNNHFMFSIKRGGKFGEFAVITAIAKNCILVLNAQLESFYYICIFQAKQAI